MVHEGPIEKAIAYMEAHLTGRLSLEDVAQVAGYSPFHFHRLFLAATGETPAAYIRRRRLTESARELAEPGRRTLDVALTYQYDSQEAFIRAFRRHFGVTPGRYQRWDAAGGAARTLPDMLPSGGKIMEPRIVQRDAFTVVGMIYYGGNGNGEIPKLWDRFNQREEQIPHRVPGEAFGLCFTESGAPDPDFWYVAALPVSKIDEIPPEMVAKTVPAHTYAVFTHRGPLASLGETYARAYQTWLPHSEYELAATFDFELYDHRFNLKEQANSELDIYLPVRRKS